MKTCPQCGQSKSIEDFARDKSQADGRVRHCRACISANYGHKHRGPSTVTATTKRCPRCTRTLLHAQFYVLTNGRLSAHCRDCTAAMLREHRKRQATVPRKKCASCGQKLELEQFPRSTKTEDGRYPSCSKCAHEASRQLTNEANRWA